MKLLKKVDLLKAETNFGGPFHGFSVQGTVGGTLGSAHIGGAAGAYYDRKNGTFNIKVQENFGFGLGQKGGIEIKIPIPHKN